MVNNEIMRRTFYFLILIIGITGCKKSTDKYSNNAFLQPKDNIRAILDSFVIENNIDNYVYELYVDKKTPHDYVLTIYCGAESLTKLENDHNGQTPLDYTIVSGKRFDVYSGIERYFKRGNDTIAVIAPLKNYLERNIWIIKDNYDTIRVFKDLEFPYPFAPLPGNFPNEKFAPPAHHSM
jgi:hypothetical protein